MYRMCISFGDRDRGPGMYQQGTTHPSALGEERVGVIDCGPSLGDYIVLDIYVPGTRYIFLTPWYTLPVICIRSIYQVQHIGGLHVPDVNHC